MTTNDTPAPSDAEPGLYPAMVNGQMALVTYTELMSRLPMLHEAVWRYKREFMYRSDPINFTLDELETMIDAQRGEIERLSAEVAALRAEDDAQWKVQCSHCGHITIGHSPHHFQNIINEGGMFSKTIDMSDNLPDDGAD